MDPQRFRDAYERLQSLDERLAHRIRPRHTGLPTHQGIEQLEAQVRVLTEYTMELKEVLNELFVAIGSKPGAGGGEGAQG